jgi:hypothetical protein
MKRAGVVRPGPSTRLPLAAASWWAVGSPSLLPPASLQPPPPTSSKAWSCICLASPCHNSHSDGCCLHVTRCFRDQDDIVLPKGEVGIANGDSKLFVGRSGRFDAVLRVVNLVGHRFFCIA